MTEHRAEFVALAQQPGANRRALCRHVGIAPMTGDKWLRRYAAEGPARLQDRSRRPHRSPARTAPAIERAVLALRVRLARHGVQPLPAGSPSRRSCPSRSCRPHWNSAARPERSG